MSWRESISMKSHWDVPGRKMARDTLSGALIAVAAAVLSTAATAHPGGIAEDGCHNQHPNNACHCHRTGASRPGCTEWCEGGHDSSDESLRFRLSPPLFELPYFAEPHQLVHLADGQGLGRQAER